MPQLPGRRAVTGEDFIWDSKRPESSQTAEVPDSLKRIVGKGAINTLTAIEGLLKELNQQSATREKPVAGPPEGLPSPKPPIDLYEQVFPLPAGASDSSDSTESQNN